VRSGPHGLGARQVERRDLYLDPGDAIAIEQGGRRIEV
jgi:hypothetical protein